MNKRNRLHFGCGEEYLKEFINIDCSASVKPDLIMDMNKYPYPFEDNTITEILANNVLEHLDSIIKPLKEFHRICKNNATIKITVPYYHSMGAFQDPTHKQFYTPMTFSYFSTNTNRHYTEGLFIIEEITYTSTIFGKLFPKFMRTKASYIFGEVYRMMHIKLKVKK